MHTITNDLSATQFPTAQPDLPPTHRISRGRRALICATLFALIGVGLAAGALVVHPMPAVAHIASLRLPALAYGTRTRACGGTLAPC
jgi:hypothetical protein